MSFFKGLLRALGGGSAPAARSAGAQVLVVDAQTLAAMRRNSPRITPRDQVDALNELCRISEREKVQIVAVLEGEPLREVANGGTYKGMLVFFSPASTEFPALMVKVYKEQSRRKTTVAVSGDRKLEEALRAAGAETIRITTFRRGFDDYVPGPPRESGRDDRRSQGPGPQRERRRPVPQSSQRPRPGPDAMEPGDASDATEFAPASDAPIQEGVDSTPSDAPARPAESSAAGEERNGNRPPARPKSDVSDLIDLV